MSDPNSRERKHKVIRVLSAKVRPIKKLSSWIEKYAPGSYVPRKWEELRARKLRVDTLM
ncbi:hypothetical protein B0H10DRAFT_2229991 [Mycena sp. CBHHK59/15]|nr:hypothetical protein B0H10DRAFT_2243070 [Mycena sp. CBHHK59/15]KAJ6603061.1 hypothetical protein B0H10DRAFT_2229991 [Mycena sp. CBHHK59/15]